MTASREVLSTGQVAVLVALSRFSLTLVYFPAMADPDVKQDVWLASLLGALWGIPFAWVLNRLWQRFPDRTFAEVVEDVLGKTLGKAVTFSYLTFYLLTLSTDLRMVGEFYVYAFLPRTPIIVLIGVVAFLAAWAAAAGVEVIGRAGQVIFPLLIGSILLIFILLLKEIRFSALAPVFIQSGTLANLKQMTSVVARNNEFAWLGMLVPFVSQRRGLFRAVTLGLICQGLVWTVMGIAVTGTLGAFQQLLYFPFHTAVKQISIAEFLEHLDALVLGGWFFGMFLRDGLMLWALSLGAAQWLGLRDYRPLVIPLTGLAVTGSIAVAHSFPEVRGYLRPEIFSPYMLTFIWVIPVGVLVVAAVRGRRGDAARP